MPHWVVMVGDPHLTCLNNFCVHLLVGCNGLEKNACSFLVRDSFATSGDSFSKLRGTDCEDVQHFISSFSSSFSLHTLLVYVLPCPLCVLPDLTADPRDFDDVVLCVCVHWLDNLGCPAILPTATLY